MNNDLISRSSLKKAIKSYADDQYAENEYLGECAIMDIIDNAPTVEPFEPDYVGAERLKARQRGYEEGYHYGMEIGKTLNPKIKQGEWITFPTNHSIIQCPECTALLNNLSVDVFKNKIGNMNFCPNCGAKMKGNKE